MLNYKYSGIRCLKTGLKAKDNCPNCDKYINILWEQIFWDKNCYRKNKKQYLTVKCPECSFIWDIQKIENFI